MSKKGDEKELFGLLHVNNNRVNAQQSRAEAEAKIFLKAGVNGLVAQGFDNEVGRKNLDSVLKSVKSFHPLIIHLIGNDYKHAFDLAMRYKARAVVLDYIPQSQEGGWGNYQTDTHYLEQAEKINDAGIGILVKAGARNEAALNADYGSAQGILFRSDRDLTVDEALYFRNKTEMLIAGHGTTKENVFELLPHVDGVIVGANCREEQRGYGRLVPEEVQLFVDLVRRHKIVEE